MLIIITTTNDADDNALPAHVFRVMGGRRAVCSVRGGGVMEVVLAPTSARTFMTPEAGAAGAHTWAPRAVRLQPPIAWNAARGVLEAAGV
jgi:hypothetical protein